MSTPPITHLIQHNPKGDVRFLLYSCLSNACGQLALLYSPICLIAAFRASPRNRRNPRDLHFSETTRRLGAQRSRPFPSLIEAVP